MLENIHLKLKVVVGTTRYAGALGKLFLLMSLQLTAHSSQLTAHSSCSHFSVKLQQMEIFFAAAQTISKMIVEVGSRM